MSLSLASLVGNGASTSCLIWDCLFNIPIHSSPIYPFCLVCCLHFSISQWASWIQFVAFLGLRFYRLSSKVHLTLSNYWDVARTVQQCMSIDFFNSVFLLECMNKHTVLFYIRLYLSIMTIKWSMAKQITILMFTCAVTSASTTIYTSEDSEQGVRDSAFASISSLHGT